MKIDDRFKGTPDWLVGKVPEHLFVFTHIPKAAGTSFTGLLGNLYGRHLGLYYGHWASTIVGDPLPEMTLETARDLHAFSSHEPWGIHKQFASAASPEARKVIGAKKIVYATLLRDPLDRFYSGYRYIRSAIRNPRHEIVSQMSFKEFLMLELKAARGRKSLNLMCEMVTGRQNTGFEEARQALGNFAVAAPISKSLEVIEVLRGILGWPDTVEYQRRNETRDKPAPDAVEMKEARDLALFEEDQQLYDYIDRIGVLKGRETI